MKATVLVLEDNQEVFDRIKSELEEIDPQLRIQRARTAADAIRDAASTRPDAVVLVEVSFRHGGGWEAIASLKRNRFTEDVPVIVSSTYADKLSRSFGSVSASECVDKPYDARDLYQKLVKVISETPKPGCRPRSMSVEFLKLFGQAASLSGFIIFFLTFMTAYYNPTRLVMIDINGVAEAEAEYWVVVAMLMFAVSAVVLTYRDVVDAVYARRTHKLLGSTVNQGEVAELFLISLVHLITGMTSPHYAVYVTKKLTAELTPIHPLLAHFHVEADERGDIGFRAYVDAEVNSTKPKKLGIAINALIDRLDSVTGPYPLKMELWTYMDSKEGRLRWMRAQMNVAGGGGGVPT